MLPPQQPPSFSPPSIPNESGLPSHIHLEELSKKIKRSRVKWRPFKLDLVCPTPFIWNRTHIYQKVQDLEFLFIEFLYLQFVQKWGMPDIDYAAVPGSSSPTTKNGNKASNQPNLIVANLRNRSANLTKEVDSRNAEVDISELRTLTAYVGVGPRAQDFTFMGLPVQGNDPISMVWEEATRSRCKDHVP